jgi:hypothetical protein
LRKGSAIACDILPHCVALPRAYVRRCLRGQRFRPAPRAATLTPKAPPVSRRACRAGGRTEAFDAHDRATQTKTREDWQAAETQRGRVYSVYEDIFYELDRAITEMMRR